MANTPRVKQLKGDASGSILFIGANGQCAEDNFNLFWDDNNSRLGLLTATPQATLHIDGSVRFSGLTTTPAAGDVLQATNTNGDLDWIPSSGLGAQELNDLSDVTTGFPVTTTEADDGKLLFYDFITDQWITDDTVTHGTVVVNGKKSTAGTIAKGTPVYLVGFDADLHTVEAANATSSATMPVIGFAGETLDATNSKHIITFGKITGIDTTSTGALANGESWSINDDLYIDTTTGELTNVRPIGAATQIQRVAKVLRVDASGGQLLIFNTARTAGLPNLTENKVWVGNSNNQPVEGEAPVWAEATAVVDAVYGNDSTGQFENLNRPFLTIQAAVSAATSGSKIIIRKGTYDEIVTSGSKELNVHFEFGAVHTSTDATSAILWSGATSGSPVNVRFTGFPKFISNATGTTGLVFNGTSTVGIGTTFYFENAYIENNSTKTLINLTAAGLWKETYVVCSAAPIFNDSSNSNTPVFDTCYFEATTTDICGLDNGAVGVVTRIPLFHDCWIYAPAGKVIDAGAGDLNMRFRDCYIETLNTPFDGRITRLGFNGTNYIKVNATTNQSVIIWSTTIYGIGSYGQLQSSGTLVVWQDPANTAPVLNISGEGKANGIMNGSVMTTNTWNTGTIIPAIRSTVTGLGGTGSTWWFNLPANYHQTLPGYVRAEYVEQAGDTLQDIADGLIAAIHVKVNTPGDPWNIFCSGDTGNVYSDAANRVRIQMGAAAPSDRISITTNYLGNDGTGTRTEQNMPGNAFFNQGDATIHPNNAAVASFQLINRALAREWYGV